MQDKSEARTKSTRPQYREVEETITTKREKRNNESNQSSPERRNKAVHIRELEDVKEAIVPTKEEKKQRVRSIAQETKQINQTAREN